MVADFDDVRRLVLALPDTTEGTTRGHLFWRVHGRGFVWERPLGKKDRAELGDAAPEGPLLGARVESLGAKEALVADPSGIYFTIAHFDGYTAVLVRLREIPLPELRELVVEAWLCRAPPKLAREWAAEHLPQPG